MIRVKRRRSWHVNRNWASLPVNRETNCSRVRREGRDFIGKWAIVSASRSTGCERRRFGSRIDQRSLVKDRKTNAEHGDRGGDANGGQAGNRPDRLRRPNGIRQVTPQVDGISALHSPSGSWSPVAVSFSLATSVRYASPRSLSFLYTCTRVTSSPDRDWQPDVPVPSAAFAEQVACRACWYFSFCLHYFGQTVCGRGIPPSFLFSLRVTRAPTNASIPDQRIRFLDQDFLYTCFLPDFGLGRWCLPSVAVGVGGCFRFRAVGDVYR